MSNKLTSTVDIRESIYILEIERLEGILHYSYSNKSVIYKPLELRLL